jgi:hypothetical protein
MASNRVSQESSRDRYIRRLRSIACQ